MIAGRSLARPAPTTNDASAELRLQRLAAEQLLDHRDAPVGRQRVVGERERSSSVPSNVAGEAEELVLDLAEMALDRGATSSSAWA